MERAVRAFDPPLPAPVCKPQSGIAPVAQVHLHQGQAGDRALHREVWVLLNAGLGDDAPPLLVPLPLLVVVDPE
eukprot:9716141-Lingulodinium_polyedra.AAC.1